MTQARRVKLSAMQRTNMWSRWNAGQSLHMIGRAVGKSHVSIHFMLSQHGGIVPAARRRSSMREGCGQKCLRQIEARSAELRFPDSCRAS